MAFISALCLLFGAAPLVSAGGTIFGVTTNSGSLFGGSKLLIHGTGLSHHSNGGVKTMVFIGVDECEVEDYFSTDTLLTCYTPPAQRDVRGIYMSGVALDIKVTNPTQLNTREMYFKGSSSFKFTHSWDRTPVMSWLYAGGAQGKELRTWGTFKVDQAAAYRISIDGSQCAIQERASIDENDLMDNNGYGLVRCLLGEGMRPGRHNITFRLDVPAGTPANGHAMKGRRALQVEPFSQTLYQFTAHPRISRVSQVTSGLGGGQELTIDGSGFDVTAANNQVFIGSNPCNVTFASATSVRCIVPSVPTGSALSSVLRPAGRGLVHKIWYGTSAYAAMGPASGGGRPADNVTTNTGSLMGLHLNDGTDNYVQELTGFFVPPVTALYSFYLMSDDGSQVMISTDHSPANLRTVNSLSGFKGNFWFGEASQISAPTLYEAGKPYYFRAIHSEGWGGDYLTVGLRVHGTNADGSVNSAVSAMKGGVQKAYASVPEVQRIEVRTTVIREQQRITIAGAGSGRMSVFWGQSSALTSIPFDASANTFSSALSGYPCSAYSVTREPFNFTTQTTPQAAGFAYTVTINCPLSAANTPWPTISLISESLVSAPGVRDVELMSQRIRDASRPVSGSFRLGVSDGTNEQVTAPIHFAAPNWVLENTLEALQNVAAIDVEVLGSTTTLLEGGTWWVTFHAPNDNLPKLAIITEDDAGFPTLFGEDVTATVVEVQQGSDDPFFNPAPMDFFRTALAAEPITVVSNGITSDCDVFAFNTSAPITSAASNASQACAFRYEASLTPTLGAVSADVTTTNDVPVYAGDSIVIEGSGFLTPASMNTVMIGSSPCVVTAAEATRLTCTLGAGTIGVFEVRVLVGDNRGLALPPVSSPWPRVRIGQRPTDFSPKTGSKAGGTLLEVRGSGFKIFDGKTANGDKNTVLIGTRECVVLSSTTSIIRCRTPAAVDQSSATSAVYITVDGEAVYTGTDYNGDPIPIPAFTYAQAKTPVITAMTPSRVPAGITAVLTVTLTGVPSATAVTAITFGTRVCRVESVAWGGSVSASSTVSCTLIRGGVRPLPQLPIAPTLEVAEFGYADASAVTLDDSFRVDSLSMAYGSLDGDNVVTFTGTGFSPLGYPNEASFEHVDTWGYSWSTPCVPLPLAPSADPTTTFTCMLPSIPDGKRGDTKLWTATSPIAGAFKLKVNNVTAPCHASTSGCAFTQRIESTPVVTANYIMADSSSPSGLALQLVGERLDLLAGGLNVKVGSCACSPNVASSATSLTCKLPIGPAGKVPITASAGDIGDTRFAASASTYIFRFAAQDYIGPTLGSVAGGALLRIPGQGFSIANISANEVSLVSVVGSTTTTLPALVVSATESELVVRTPQHPSLAVGSSQSFNIYVVNREPTDPALDPIMLPTPFTYDYSTVTTGVRGTPTITNVAPLTGTAGTDIVITGTNFGNFSAVDDPANAPSFVTIGGVPCVLRSPMATNSSDTVIRCRVGQVPAGKHRVLVYRPSFGYARNNAMATSYFTATLTVSSVSPRISGFGGGQLLTIRGKGFAPTAPSSDGMPSSASGPLGVNQVVIGNRGCVIVNATWDTLYCRTSPLLTPASLNALPIYDAAVLQPQVLIPSTASALAAFDGDAGTTFTGCSIVSDLGASSRAIVTGARVFPKFRTTGSLAGAVFQGSNDNAVWITLGSVGSTVFEGWNNVQIVSAPGVTNLVTTALNVTSAIASVARTEQLGSLPAFRYLRLAFAPAVTGSSCVGQEIEFRGFVIAAPSANNGGVDGLHQLEIAVNASKSLPAVFGGGPNVLSASVVGLSTNATDGTVQYSLSATPFIREITPNNGTALGGTLVTLLGSNLPASADGIAELSLNGIPCAVQSSSPTAVTCVTGPRGTDIQMLSVVLRVRDEGAASTDSVTGRAVTISGMAVFNPSTVFFRYIDRWSALTTWKYQEPPVEGDTVVVPMGQSILVDVSPPRLYLVLVEGELMFDNADLRFEASYFIAHGGKISAGSFEKPFLNKLTIVLHGERRKAVEIPDLGAKNIVVTSMGMDHDEEDETPEPGTVPSWHSKNAPRKRPASRASLDLHGKPRKRVWTMLAESALAGTDTIKITEDVDWTVGETLVVTDNQVVWNSEEVVVQEVLGPRTLKLTAPLKNDHRSWWATAPTGTLIDERAEVMLLSRNIRVQGDDEFSDRDLFGVHIAAMHGDSILRLSNIEITQAGQAGNLGRYPAHTHELEDNGRDSFVIGNSIHHTYQRGTTIHKTHFARVAHNAYFNCLGHTVFVEDGVEQWNTFEENLVAMSLPCHVCTESDFKPANFWTASPTNIWRNNRAAGGTHFGFWFELPDRPLGPSYRPDYYPKHMPLVEFRNNTVHSAESMGLRIYPGWNPRLVPGDDNSLAMSMYLHNNVFVFNNEGTFHRVVGAVHHVNSIFADNEQAFGWRQLEGGITLHSNNPFIRDSLFVCSTTSPEDCGWRRGFVGPQSEFWYCEGLTFANYGPNGRPLSGCHSCEVPAFMKQGAFTYRVGRLSFINSAKRVSWNSPYKCIFQDLDGTLTNQAGSFGVPAGGWVVAPFKFNNFCPPDTSVASVFEGGNVCDNSVTVRKVTLDWHAPVELDFQSLNVTSAAGWDVVKFRPREVYGWAFPVVQRQNYAITWTRPTPGLPLADWTRMRVKWGGDPSYIDTYNANLNAKAASTSTVVKATDREFMGLTFGWAFTRYRNAVRYGGWANGGSLAGTWVERPDLPTFGDMPGASHAFATGSRPGDQSGPMGGLNRTWSVVMTTINATLPAYNAPSDKYTFSAWAEQCPPNGCVDPSAMNLGEATMWSSPASWPSLGGRLPREGEDLMINSTSYIVMDVNPPKLGTVTINGKLAFLDNGYRKLEADKVVVWGELAIGSAATPFNNQADIILHGQWPGNTMSGAGPNAPITLDNNLFLGNKAMAVLGKVTMVAKPKATVWAKLATTAAAGATTITLSNSVAGSWLPGEKIVLAATSFDYNQYETATIRSVSGAVVTLEAPLQYSHFAGPVAASGIGASVRLHAAVGLLSRSVRFMGNLTSSTDTYGASMLVHGVTRTSASSPTVKRLIQGQVELRHVEIRNGGKLGLEYPALRLQYGNYLYDQSPVASNPVNVIEGVSFTNSFNYALLGVSAKHLLLNSTVFYNSYRNGVDLDAQSWNATVTNNLLVGNRKSPDVNAADQMQWIQPQTGFLINAWASTFSNNVASGCYDAAFTYRLPECSSAGTHYDGNEAYGVRIGAFLLPTATASRCVKPGRMLVAKASHLGMVSVDQVSNVNVEGYVSVDNHIGMSLNYFGSRLPGLAVGKVTDSTFIGSTPLLSPSCADSVCRAASESDPDGVTCGSVLGAQYRRAGILIPSYYNRAKTCDQDDELPVCNKPNYVSRLCSLPWENRYGTIGTFNAQLHLSDVRFGGFALSECGNKRSSAIVANPAQIDMSTPVYARGIVWDAGTTAAEARFHFDINDMTASKCQGGVGCDGLGYVYLLDLDGSLLGRGAQATLMGDNPLAALPSPACQSFPTWKGILCSSATTFRKAYLEGIEVGRIAMGLLQHTRQTSALENRTSMSVGSFKDECSMQPGQPYYAHFITPGVDSALFFPATEPSQIRYTVLASPTDATAAANDPSVAGVVASLLIQRPYSWEVYVGQSSSVAGKDLSTLSSATVTRYPTRTDEPGSYLFVPQEKKLYFTVRPGVSTVYTLVRKPAVQLNVNLRISVEDFYNAQGSFLESLSILLSIPSWRIKIVDVRAGSANVQVEIADEAATVFHVSNTTASAGVPEETVKRAEAQIQRLNELVVKLGNLASGGQLNKIAGIEVGGLSLIPPTSALVASTSPSLAAGGSGSGAPVTTLTLGNGGTGNTGTSDALSGGAVAGIVIGVLAAVALAAAGFVIHKKRSATGHRRVGDGPRGRGGMASPTSPDLETGGHPVIVRGRNPLGLRTGSNKGIPIPDHADDDHQAPSAAAGTGAQRIFVNPGSVAAAKGNLAFQSKGSNRSLGKASPNQAPASPGSFVQVSPIAAGGQWEHRHNKLAYYKSGSSRAFPGGAATLPTPTMAASSVLGNNLGPIAPARTSVVEGADVSRTGSIRAKYEPVISPTVRPGRTSSAFMADGAGHDDGNDIGNGASGAVIPGLILTPGGRPLPALNSK